MAEYWDLYDENRALMGKTHQRGIGLPEGTYHVVVSVWTVNQDNKILLTLRSATKPLFPNRWENTSGAVQQGENSKDAAMRELVEETGIKSLDSEMSFLGTAVKMDSFVDIFLVRKDLDPSSITLQDGETTDYKWVSYQELKQIDEQGKLAFPLFPQLQAVFE